MKSFKLLTFITVLLLGAQTQVFAQQTVTGVVIDADTKETLPGVNVIVLGTTKGVATDLDGRFQLTLEPGETVLQFSYLGYEKLELTVAGETELRVELKPIVTMMDEVVVIGYGTVKKSDLTGAVSSIKSADIGKVTAFNAEQSLQGKVSGVQITTTSGAPGAGAAVRIRGVGTFNNSSPIYVVDGVILDDISFLNSGDIASMEILKDASATAIYGSRGANGVILVQTKTGSASMEKPIVSLMMESGLQQLERKIDLLDGRQFAIISNEIRPGSYNNVDAVPNTDWQDLIFDVAPMQNHQISVTGSTANSDYYISFGVFQQDGIIDRSHFERITLKFNNTYRLTKQFKLGNNLTIAPYSQQVAPNVTFSAYRAQPLLEPYYPDGSYGVVFNVGNPLADLENSNNYNSGVRVVGNVYAEALLANAFLVKSSFGTDAALNRSRSFTPAYTVFNPDGTASQQQNVFNDISKSEGINYTWLWENTVTFNKTFQKKHSVNVLGGFTMQQTRSESMRMAGQNILREDEDFWYILPSYIIDEANNINMLNSIFNGVDPNQYYNMMSYLFRFSYTFDEKYLATVTVRRDGSSKFNETNRWGTFPSFALGWNVNKESFMKNVTWVNDLKIRASWGQIGNEKIAYTDRFSSVNSGLLAIFGNPDAAYVAASYGRAGNAELRWETTTQTDVGIEFTSLNRRLSGEFDYYSRTTDDILVSLATPGHLGNGQGQRIRFNAAQILNSGFEFSLRWDDRFNDLGYSIGVVGNTIHNEVQAIGGNAGIDSVLIGGFLGNGQPVTQSTIGRPIGAFYGYVTDGIFQNQAELDAYPHLGLAGVGDLRFVDINGDGIINGNDRTYLGSPIPDFVYGFNFDFDYKGWDLSIGFQGQMGNEIFNGKNVVRPDPYNFEAHVWNRWTGEGTSNSEPRPSFGGYNFLPSDRFIHDGSYLRLRSVVIGYTLPKKWISSLRLASARVYAKANNLYTWTSYTGYTPEIGSFDVLSNGIDNGIYPIPRVFAIGFNTTF